MYRVWAAIWLTSVVAIVPCAAYADQTTAGISIIVVHGQHVEQNGIANAPLVPAPVLELSRRSRSLEVSAEGIPPLRSYAVGSNALGIRSIGLSYFQSSIRYWNKAGTFAAGVGETLYNQRTDYVIYSSSQLVTGQYDASRVVGARYEIVGRKPLGTQSGVELSLSVNPSLHGRMGWTDYQTFAGRLATLQLPPEWERGSQVQLVAQVDRRAGAFGLRYGIRYLNYIARFDDGTLADRNTFIMPFFGVTRAFGP
jgi:hypothetical protein